MDAKTLESYFYGNNIDSSLISKGFRKSKIYQDSVIEPYESGRFYIFMTRPDLNLHVANLRAMDILGQDEGSYDNPILQRLVSQLYVTKDSSLLGPVLQALGIIGDPYLPKVTEGRFINIITNLHKTAPLKDITADAKTAFETYDGYGMVLGGHSKDSRSKGEFSITYNETKDLEIMKLHSIWTRYIDFAHEGLVSRSKENRDKHILDYASSLYVFAVEPDGETLSFWAKYSGVIPMGIPWTSLGENLGDSAIITPAISYKYTYYEDNTLDILRDFTNLVSGQYDTKRPNEIYKGKDRGISTHMTPQVNANIPIQTNDPNKGLEYSYRDPKFIGENTYQDPYKDPISNDSDIGFYKDNGYIYQDYQNVQIVKETSRYKLKFYNPLQR